MSEAAMGERILVTGATGKVGRELVRSLRADGQLVRAGTRDPDRAATLFGKDVETVELDFMSTVTYDAAVQWVDRIFLMPPPFDPDAFDTLAPFLDWAVASGTTKVVLLSAMDADAVPELALRRLETHLESLDIAWTILRPNLYMQNLTSGFMLNAIRERGVIELSAGDSAVSFVDVQDVAAAAAVAIETGSFDGRILTLTGPDALGFETIAAMLSEAAGRSIGFTPVSNQRMRDILRAAHWPERQVAVGVGLFESVRNGRRAPVHEDVANVTGRAPTTFGAFTAANAPVWR
jgi:uncharacterized protein YbjT (DUF2867 family)